MIKIFSKRKAKLELNWQFFYIFFPQQLAALSEFKTHYFTTGTLPKKVYFIIYQVSLFIFLFFLIYLIFPPSICPPLSQLPLPSHSPPTNHLCSNAPPPVPRNFPSSLFLSLLSPHPPSTYIVTNSGKCGRNCRP